MGKTARGKDSVRALIHGQVAHRDRTTKAVWKAECGVFQGHPLTSHRYVHTGPAPSTRLGPSRAQAGLSTQTLTPESAGTGGLSRAHPGDPHSARPHRLLVCSQRWMLRARGEDRWGVFPVRSSHGRGA